MNIYQTETPCMGKNLLKREYRTSIIRTSTSLQYFSPATQITSHAESISTAFQGPVESAECPDTSQTWIAGPLSSLYLHTTKHIPYCFISSFLKSTPNSIFKIISIGEEIIDPNVQRLQPMPLVFRFVHIK